MKFYQIALFIFAFNASLSILNSANIFGVYIQHDTQWISELNKYNNSHTVPYIGNYTIPGTAIFGDFIKGLRIIKDALANATILLPFFLAKLGAPVQINAVITAGTWLVYIIAIAQFLSGRVVER